MMIGVAQVIGVTQLLLEVGFLEGGALRKHLGRGL